MFGLHRLIWRFWELSQGFPRLEMPRKPCVFMRFSRFQLHLSFNVFFSLFCTCYKNHAFSRVFRAAGLRFRACFKAVCSSFSSARSSNMCRKPCVLLCFSRFAGRAIGLLFFTPALARFSTLFRNVAKITRFHAFFEIWPPTLRSFWVSGNSFSAFPELRR